MLWEMRAIFIKTLSYFQETSTSRLAPVVVVRRWRWMGCVFQVG